MMSMLARLKGHFQEYVARYSVLALAVLVPLSGALGSAAAHLGGAGTPGGRIAIGASSAVGTAIAGVTFLRNLGIWQMLDRFGTAPLVPKGEAPNVVAGGDVTVETKADTPAAPTPTPVQASDSSPPPGDIGSSPQSPPDEGTVTTDGQRIVPDEDTQGELEGNEGLVSEGDVPESEATV